MSASASNSIYDKVVKITNVYLGPAADRFIARQVENHLNKSPSKLSAKDLYELIDWIKISISMLTEDGEIVEEYVRELHKLADSKDNNNKALR